MTINSKNNGEKKMARLIISRVDVIETDLYAKWAEDCEIFVYDLIVRAYVDGEVYDHNHVFKGYVEDEEGFYHPNYGAKDAAHRLADRVADVSAIDTDYWTCIGNLSEIYKTAEERLEEAWSDCSDHYEN
jgi:hypothetical protein